MNSTGIPAISTEERDIILASLRLYQHVYDETGGDVPEDILDIATYSGSHEVLDLSAIDDLCERIKV